jgi:TPR repeat protein
MRILTVILSFVCVGAFADKISEENNDFKIMFAEQKVKADQGDVIAQFSTAVNYGAGTGVKQNFVESAKYYKMSADNGYANSQSALAECYENGRGIDKDLIKAYAYISVALLSYEDNKLILYAKKRKGKIAEGMTYSQIQTAKELAVTLQAEIVARAKAEKK